MTRGIGSVPPQLKRDADGWLTLIIQNESPGKERILRQGKGSQLAA
ncbi:hypothetical protein ACVW1A_002878 [Bradyrhizobium sp. LB1.3]